MFGGKKDTAPQNENTKFKKDPLMQLQNYMHIG